MGEFEVNIEIVLPDNRVKMVETRDKLRAAIRDLKLSGNILSATYAILEKPVAETGTI